VINVELTQMGPIDNVAILARFEPDDPRGETRLLGEDSFRLAATGNYRLAQGRVALAPGPYTVTVVVADPVNVKTALYRGEIKVPETPQTMRLSDAVWAVEMAEVKYRALASYDEPFHLGPFRVLPKLTSVYRRDDTVKLFVEVFGADYPLTATYQLEGLDDDGSWKPLGQPTVLEQSAAGLAWEVATNPRWPLGRYRVHVDVIDAAGRLVSTNAEFTLESAPAEEPDTDPEPGS
jgi:hypothetical protein